MVLRHLIGAWNHCDHRTLGVQSLYPAIYPTNRPSYFSLENLWSNRLRSRNSGGQRTGRIQKAITHQGSKTENHLSGNRWELCPRARSFPISSTLSFGIDGKEPRTRSTIRPAFFYHRIPCQQGWTPTSLCQAELYHKRTIRMGDQNENTRLINFRVPSHSHFYLTQNLFLSWGNLWHLFRWTKIGCDIKNPGKATIGWDRYRLAIWRD